MAKLVTLVEQYLDRQPPTVAVEATTWWETGLAFVKLQDCGLELHLPVKVCCYYTPHACAHSAGNKAFGPVHMLYNYNYGIRHTVHIQEAHHISTVSQ